MLSGPPNSDFLALIAMNPVAAANAHDNAMAEIERLRKELKRSQKDAQYWLRDRDRWHRLFYRIEAAISHHKRDCEANDVPDVHDEALWAARDRVLRDSAEGKG